jgi:metal-responsive CopG/Arc/MetJ family transcriptional regulator
VAKVMVSFPDDLLAKVDRTARNAGYDPQRIAR